MKLIRNGIIYEIDKKSFPVQSGDRFEIEPNLWVICTHTESVDNGQKVYVEIFHDGRPVQINSANIPAPVKFGLKVLGQMSGVKYR